MALSSPPSYHLISVLAGWPLGDWEKLRNMCQKQGFPSLKKHINESFRVHYCFRVCSHQHYQQIYHDGLQKSLPVGHFVSVLQARPCGTASEDHCRRCSESVHHLLEYGLWAQRRLLCDSGKQITSRIYEMRARPWARKALSPRHAIHKPMVQWYATTKWSYPGTAIMRNRGTWTERCATTFWHTDTTSKSIKATSVHSPACSIPAVTCRCY